MDLVRFVLHVPKCLDQCGIPGSDTYRKPKLVKKLESMKVLMVACGASHTLFLTRGMLLLGFIDEAVRW
jgi:hypothetical protein